MIQYVLGFLFDMNSTHVALIRKKKPEWQAGRINGIGGKIEGDELAEEAMRREFLEEAGLNISGWDQYAIMKGKSWECFCFRSWSPDIYAVRSMTEEEIIICDIICLPSECIPNLHWLIPLALDVDLTHYTRASYE